MARQRRIYETVSREELNNAMSDFFKKGGKINVLPQQKVVISNRIGGVDSCYEDLDYFAGLTV